MISQYTSAHNLRRLRATAAVLVTMLAGYFSLATSCLSNSYTKNVELTVSFDEDEEFKLVRVRALTRPVVIGFDRPVVVPVNAPETDDTPLEVNLGGSLGVDGSGGGTASELEQPTDPIAECIPSSGPYITSCNLFPDGTGTYGDGGRGTPTDVVVRIFRFDQVGAFDLRITARGQFWGGCDGDPPEDMAIRIDEVSE